MLCESALSCEVIGKLKGHLVHVEMLKIQCLLRAMKAKKKEWWMKGVVLHELT
jgi:hypothetical protein